MMKVMMMIIQTDGDGYSSQTMSRPDRAEGPWIPIAMEMMDDGFVTMQR